MLKTIAFTADYLQEAQRFFRDYGRARVPGLLLESAEIVDKSGVQSLIGMSCALKAVCDDLTVTVTARNANGLALLTQLGKAARLPVRDGTLSRSYSRPPVQMDEESRLKAPGPFELLRCLQRLLQPCPQILIAGVIAFDFINNFEDFGRLTAADNACADFTFWIFDLSVRVDHLRRTTEVRAFAFTPECYRDTALAALELRDRINEYRADDPVRLRAPARLHVDPDRKDEDFAAIITALKRHIISGDAFQVVPSRTFRHPCRDPLLAYEYLKKLNPSPYMYFVQDDDFTLFGASPEYALRYEPSDRRVSISPIAGTRPRGLNPDGSVNRELDTRIELELRTDQKETAEHLMLVDLARNDLARIAVPGSRYVERMLHVDKYQAVMHLVSDVHARLRDDLDGFSAYQACMNMGTLSGAPKIKAHELIYRYEGHKRGLYGGVVALLGTDGAFDSCIAIRSAVVSRGTAYVQAGCGVVYDSDPQAECQETVNKARSVLTALALAEEDQA